MSLDPDMVEYYREFSFPLHNLPRPGYDVLNVDVSHTVEPILRGLAALLAALAAATHRGAMSSNEMCVALELLEGQVCQALHILDRWGEGPEFHRKEPSQDT